LAPRRSRAARYGLAVLATGSAFVLQALLIPLFGGGPNSTPFIVFFAAVMASAWLGGLGPGLLSAGLSALFSWFFFLSPQFSFALDAGQGLRLLVFAAEGVFISALAGSMHGSRGRAEAAVLELRSGEEELRARARQQEAVADLGRRALEDNDLQALMEGAVASVAQVLDVEYSKVLELLPGDEELLLRAGVGWDEGLVGRATVGADSDSQAGYTLLSDDPVVVEDLRSEARFAGPSLLREHGVVSGMSAIIRGRSRPFGVLGAHTTERRAFTEDDVNFLRAVANVLAATIEREGSEAELRASEERFRATFEQAAVGVAHVGLDGRWLRVNNKLFEITGYPREELIRKTFQDITHPDDLDADLEQARQLLAGEIETYSMEKRYIKMDGSTVWINLTVSLVREPSGEPAYFIAVIEDIAERKKAEEALGQSESRYRAVVKQSADGIYLMEGSTGRILETNPALRDMLGYGAEELRGMDLHGIVAHDPEDVYANVERTLREGWSFIRERGYRRKDGSVVEVEVAASAVDYGDKQMICAAIRDITERKRAEEARRDIRDAERRRIARDLHDGVLQDLSYTSAAIGLIMIMLQANDAKVEEQLQAAIDAVRRGAEGLREVVNDLRLEDEDGRPFAEVMESLVRRNRTMAKNVEISLEVGEGVPATPLGETGTQASRLIQEALTNARRHSHAKSISVSLRMDGPDLIAEVADDGVGLGPETSPGVGLSSMRERAAVIGGELEIASERERGTRVRLRIPRSEGGQG
jgi:PAS domain S-box-containing protein